MHRLQGVLETALDRKMVLPERKLERIEQFLERFPEVKEVILDGTERPVQRPQDAEKQKAHYSGKKKRHTRKPITGSTGKKRVILLTKARGGKIHDKRQLDEADLVSHIPDQVSVEADLGFRDCKTSLSTSICPIKSREAKS